MGVFSAGEIATDRAQMDYDTTCALKRFTNGTLATVSGYGAVPCRFFPLAIMPQEDQSGTQRVIVDDRYRFVMPYGTPVRFRDQLHVGSRAFEVIQPPESSQPLETIALCQEKNR